MSPGPSAIRLDPFPSGWRWIRQWQLKNRDGLSLAPAVADRNEAARAAETSTFFTVTVAPSTTTSPRLLPPAHSTVVRRALKCSEASVASESISGRIDLLAQLERPEGKPVE